MALTVKLFLMSVRNVEFEMNGSNAVLCSGMGFSIESGLEDGSMLLFKVLGKDSKGDAVFTIE